jgi:hypothetical protein
MASLSLSKPNSIVWRRRFKQISWYFFFNYLLENSLLSVKEITRQYIFILCTNIRLKARATSRQAILTPFRYLIPRGPVNSYLWFVFSRCFRLLSIVEIITFVGFALLLLLSLA